METLSWILSIVATVNRPVTTWLYGDGDWRGPMLGLLSCSLFMAYNVINEQWPMMLPTALTVAVHARNLIVMSRQR